MQNSIEGQMAWNYQMALTLASLEVSHKRWLLQINKSLISVSALTLRGNSRGLQRDVILHDK
jgi:hypothetical protein